jgi:hypothetical protein
VGLFGKRPTTKNAVNLKEAEEWLRSAAAEGEEEAWLEPGNLKLHSSPHDSIKEAYVWFYLAQTAKVRDAGTRQKIRFR